jgi:hypothetical protein
MTRVDSPLCLAVVRSVVELMVAESESSLCLTHLP